MSIHQLGFSKHNPLVPKNFQDFKNFFNNGLELAYVSFSPDLAKEILRNHNTNNRAISESTVKKYISEMQGGYWTLGMTDISFNENEELLDGQHRLKAVVDSQLSQVFGVKINLPSSSFGNFDAGKKRTPKDTLGVNNYKNLATLNSIIRKYRHYKAKQGSMWYLNTPCNSHEALESIKNKPLLQNIASFMDARRAFAPYGAKSDLGTCYAIFTDINEEKADAFMSMLGLKHDFNYEDANYTNLFSSLRQLLVTNNSSGKNGIKKDPHDVESRIYHYMFVAWNYFLKKKNVNIVTKVDRAKDFVAIENW